MPDFATARLPLEPQATAPDGTAVRLLAALAGGSFAHFTLPAGKTSKAVAHRKASALAAPLPAPSRGEVR